MTGPPLYPSFAQKLESPSACSFIYLSIYLSFYLSIRLLIYFQIFIHLCVDSLSINRISYEVTGAPLYKRTPHPKRRLCRLVGHGAQPAPPGCQVAQLWRSATAPRQVHLKAHHLLDHSCPGSRELIQEKKGSNLLHRKPSMST